MSKNLDWYLDEAKRRSGAKSDRALCGLLGLSTSGVVQWRTGRAYPSDEAMVKLATISQADPELALMELNTWRARGTAAAPFYERIASAMRGVVLTVVVALAFWGVTSDDDDNDYLKAMFPAVLCVSRKSDKSVNLDSGNRLYIMDNKINFL